MRVETKTMWSSQAFLTTVNSDPMELTHMGMYCIVANWVDNTPANKTFADGDVDTAADTVTITAHGYTTGVKVRLTTTGTLPTGLNTGVDYFLIVVNANTLEFATSYANAVAGTKIDITAAAGGGTHTVSVTALAGATVKLQLTNDDVNDTTITPDWRDINSSSTNITATGNTYWTAADVGYRFVRAQATLTAGYVTISAKGNAKGF